MQPFKKKGKKYFGKYPRLNNTTINFHINIKIKQYAKTLKFLYYYI